MNDEKNNEQINFDIEKLDNSKVVDKVKSINNEVDYEIIWEGNQLDYLIDF